MIRRQHVVRDFFADADAMRESLDACFKDPYSHRIRWDYFSVPQLYTYLRTEPRGVIPDTIFDSFMRNLRRWSMDNLGLVPMGDPRLHLMVNGCKLELHSDFHNGVWGYVYSLTRWEKRTFSGGETLLMRDGIPSYKKHHVHGDALYELLPAHFNQLLIFDDRIVHATPTIEGSMSSIEGRVAMVGHLRTTSPVVYGELQPEAVRAVILRTLTTTAERIRSYRDVQGTITFKLTVGPSGAVESITALTDNLITPRVGYGQSDEVDSVRSVVRNLLSAMKLPPEEGKTSIVVPVLVPLPDLRPISVAIPHTLGVEERNRWKSAWLQAGGLLGLLGEWVGCEFVVREPLSGTVRMASDRIEASFDPPMWVPSQREEFQSALHESLKATFS